MPRPRKPAPHEIPSAHVLERKLDVEALLSEETKAKLRETAALKVKARDIADAEDAYLKSEMDRLDREAHPEVHVEMREIRVDLAMYAAYAMLDGKRYYADELYTVSKHVYDVLKEMERNSYRHEAEISGDKGKETFYRRERNLNLNGRTGALTTASGQLVSGF